MATSKLKPENISKLQMEGNWVKSDEQVKRLSANQALILAKQQEREKIDSGDYEFVTVLGTHAFSKPYRTLRKKRK
jgi:hypothetical protein